MSRGNSAPRRIGVIGGSGLYQLEGLTKQKWVKVRTPFGDPSDEFRLGEIAGREAVFLPRHGRSHHLLPSELNHRANLWALKKLGAAWIISVSAVGSLQGKFRPRDIVFVNQFIDRTKKSLEHTFFGAGIVAHVAFAQPVAMRLKSFLRFCDSKSSLPAARMFAPGYNVSKPCVPASWRLLWKRTVEQLRLLPRPER